MSVLITGGAGYIGSHMVHELLETGEEVVVVDNLSTGFQWAVPGAAELVKGDIGDQHLIDRLLKDRGVDAVVHFAGSVVVPESVADPLGYYNNNTCKARNLIECCVRSGVKRFIFSSTAAVYGMTGTEPVRETVAPAPISPYGTSKLMTEWILRDTAAAHDFAYGALRYFNVAGADPQGRTGQSTPNATHLIKVASQAALGVRPEMQVFGTDYGTPDGTCIRDFIHVSDLARAHALVLGYLRDGGESTVFNCGYGHGYSVLEVIDAVERVSGRRVPRRNAPRRDGDPEAVVADAAKIRSTLGWEPQLDDLDLIVGHALSWEAGLSQRNTVVASR